jgi:hypothetical protein
MKANNELIAEFMGLVKSSIDNLYFTKKSLEGFGIGQLTELKYNTDWNWLMEVVEKIENIISDGIVFNVFIDKNKTHVFYAPANYSNEEWFSNLFLHEGDTKIKNTYNACIELIKWYNEQNN